MAAAEMLAVQELLLQGGVEWSGVKWYLIRWAESGVHADASDIFQHRFRTMDTLTRFLRVKRGSSIQYAIRAGQGTLKADSHIARRAHAFPLPCRAASLPCSDSAVSFENVRMVAGNVRTASPTA
jgi:hypothetical protein